MNPPKIDQRNNVKSTLYKKYLISRVKVGDRVLVQPRGNGIGNKFRPRFFGPYKVIEIIVDVENESKEIKTFDAHVTTLTNLGSFSEETKYLFDDSESQIRESNQKQDQSTRSNEDLNENIQNEETITLDQNDDSYSEDSKNKITDSVVIQKEEIKETAESDNKPSGQTKKVKKDSDSKK
eukprot:gene1261-11348_t